jgi:hypothetical protein
MKKYAAATLVSLLLCGACDLSPEALWGQRAQNPYSPDLEADYGCSDYGGLESEYGLQEIQGQADGSVLLVFVDPMTRQGCWYAMAIELEFQRSGSTVVAPCLKGENGMTWTCASAFAEPVRRAEAEEAAWELREIRITDQTSGISMFSDSQVRTDFGDATMDLLRFIEAN